MELRQLRQLVVLAESPSFRHAAARLHMAQPPLSVAIRKLEQEIGVSLFERGPRGIRLTAAGSAAVQVARRCLNSAEDVVMAARAAASGDAGRLRVGFIRSVMFDLMPRLIRAFSQRFPGVKLELIEATNQELLQGFEAGSLDLVFLRVPIVQPPGIEIEIVERDVFVVALPPQHPLAKRKKIALKELTGQPFIGYAPSSVGGLHAAVTQLLLRSGVNLKVAQEAAQVQTVIGFVESGLGVALVPSVNTSNKSRLIAFRPLRDAQDPSAIGIALGFNRRRESSVARRLRELVGEMTSSGLRRRTTP